MAELFGIDKSGISRHLAKIFETGELDEEVVVAKIATTNPHGKTAAEIVYHQADYTKENMGLTTWKNAPDGRILKSDTSIAKNYLDEKQIRQLERAVTGYFDYIEDLIERENVFTMEEFSKSINEFLEFRRYDILKDNGRITHKQAVEKAYFTSVSNVDSLDWKDYGAKSIISTVTQHKHLGNGSIILCHNGAKYTAQALEELIVELKKQGYQLVPVSQLIYPKPYELDHEGRQTPITNVKQPDTSKSKATSQKQLRKSTPQN